MVIDWISPDRLEGGRAALVVAEIYALFNVVILCLAAAMALEVPRPRRGERFPVHRQGSYDLGDEEGEFACVLLDISETGALLGNVRPVYPGVSIDLEIPGIGTLPAQVVRCTESNVAVEFSGLAENQRLRIIDFIYSPAFPTR